MTMKTMAPLLVLMAAAPATSVDETFQGLSNYQINAQLKHDSDPMRQLLKADSLLGTLGRFVEKVRTRAGSGLRHQRGVFVFDVKGIRMESLGYPDMRSSICCQLGEYVQLNVWQDMFIDNGIKQSQGARLSFQIRM